MIDYSSKRWAINLHETLSYGSLHFSLQYNPGSMLGLFADLPPFLRVVTISTGGAFLAVTFALIQYLLPIRSLILRSGMSVLLGGILGNVTDRVIWGKVADFIYFTSNSINASPVFNMADLFQWIGYLMIVYSIIKHGKVLWYEKNQRKEYWINPQFQLKYCYLLLAVGLSVSLIVIVFSYTFLRISLIEIVGHNPLILEKFLTTFLITFSIICISFCLILFTVGKIISHKLAGPIYAFEKYLDDLISAKENKTSIRRFKLRAHDEFIELERVGSSIKNKFAPEVQELD
ncbi:MAG: signal peptidase II [Bacteriovorax sp.]|nr:signal peptidase II [Bacteriovorax sp.]